MAWSIIIHITYHGRKWQRMKKWKKTLFSFWVMMSLAAMPALSAGNEEFRTAQSIGNFSEGFAAFQNADGLWGYIDRQGQVVIAPVWTVADIFSEGRARIGSGSGDSRKYGLIDASGNLVATLTDNVSSYWEGMATVTSGGMVSYIDLEGNDVFGRAWKSASPFHEGLAAVVSEGSDLTGFINTSGEQVIAGQWERSYGFSEGLAAVRKDNLWGYIDRSGAVVIEPQYDDCNDFCNGLAAVEKDDWEGYIDASGTVVIPLQYENASHFRDGHAWVKRDGVYQMIDTQGNPIGDAVWDNVYSDFGKAGMCRVKRGEKWGYVNQENRLILDAVYDQATAFSDGIAAVQRNGIWYLIDTNGTDILTGEDTQK